MCPVSSDEKLWPRANRLALADIKLVWGGVMTQRGAARRDKSLGMMTWREDVSGGGSYPKESVNQTAASLRVLSFTG